MRIYLDMDGVLVNFYDAAFRHFNYQGEIPLGEFHIHQVLGLTEDEFWAGLPEDFYYTLDPLPDWQDIIKIVKGYDKDWHILSSPGPTDQAATHKIRWLRKYIGRNFDRYVITKHKVENVGPNKVLIDDYDKQIKRFVDGGGYGILLPRKWNMGYNRIDCTLEYLDNALYARMVEIGG